MKANKESIIDIRNMKSFKKQMLKHMETSIVFGVPNSISYQKLNLNKSLNQYPLDELQLHVNNIIKYHCKKDIVILNTNLPEGIKI